MFHFQTPSLLLAFSLLLLATGCRPGPAPSTCTQEEGQCIDTCQAGKSCNEACTECVTATNPFVPLEEQPCFTENSTYCSMELCTARAIENGLISVQQYNNLDEDEPETWFRCDEDCGFCLPPESNEPKRACQGFHDHTYGTQCLDDCPEGQECDDDCMVCINIPQTLPCTLVAGTCQDGCAEGQECNAQCNACQPIPRPPEHGTCSLQGNACQNSCDPGYHCNEGCDGCIPDHEVTRSCQTRDSTCLDACSDSERCDDDCGTCIPHDAPPGCSTIHNRCVNNCGPGKGCNDDCTACTRGG